MSISQRTHSEPGKDQGTQLFRGGTTREALNQVRRELGADAIILKQVETAEGVTIEACLEMPEPEAIPVLNEAVAEPGQNLFTVLAEEPDDVVKPQIQTGGSRNVGWRAQGRAQGYSDAVLEDFAFCKDLNELRRQVIQRMDYFDHPVEELTGCYRFVGAAGSGKTTALIKVLLAWVVHNQPERVAVVSTDRDRLGSTESLQLATQMLGVQLTECDPGGLAAQLERLRDKSLILVDSPAVQLGCAGNTGRPNNNQPDGNGLPADIQGVKDVWVVSVLHNLPHVVAQQALLGRLHGLIVSHVDQLLSPDEWLNHIYRSRIPLVCMNGNDEITAALVKARVDCVMDIFAPQTVSQQSVSVNKLAVTA